MRHDAFAMLEVRGEHPVEASEVQPRAWDQCGQAGNEVQRFQHDMGRPPTIIFHGKEDKTVPFETIDRCALTGPVVKLV